MRRWHVIHLDEHRNEIAAEHVVAVTAQDAATIAGQRLNAEQSRRVAGLDVRQVDHGAISRLGAALVVALLTLLAIVFAVFGSH